MKTFEAYLIDAEHAGVTNHELRMQRGPGGEVRFSIHPQGKGGETLDFESNGNSVGPVFDFDVGELVAGAVFEDPNSEKLDQIIRLLERSGGGATAA